MLTQVATVGKGQELAAAKVLLGQIPLEGKIVVADALLTQREVCQQIVAGGGDYLLPVKENQSTLQQDLADAFSPSGKRRGQGSAVAAWQAREWRERGATLTVWVDESPKRRHGRRERRELWALADPELNRYAGSAGTVGEGWPHLRQICRIERQRTVNGRTQTTVSYAVTSVAPAA